MKKRLINYITILTVLLLLGVSNVSANSNIIDISKKGSLNISLSTNDSKVIKGAEITIYKVGDVVVENSNLIFKNVPEINSCKIDFTKVENITTSMVECIQNTNVKKETNKTDREGKVSFTNLDLGLYLVVQTNEVKGYSKIDSYLTMIPEEIDNKWIYDITSTPKTEIYQTIDVKVIKVWNKQNENSKLPEFVTIQLLKDDEVLDTVELNKENNWTYTWLDIEKSDKYTVKEIDIPDGYTATYKNEGYTFTITNTDKLPLTGQLKWPIIVLFSTGVLFITLGIYESKREQN